MFFLALSALAQDQKWGKIKKKKNQADYLDSPLSSTLSLSNPILLPQKRKKKAMIRFKMLNKYPWAINYSSWKAMTKEKYFLISCIFLFKRRPDTYVSPSKPWQCMTIIMLMEIECSVQSWCFSPRKDHCSLPPPPPHLTVKIGQQCWTSKIKIAKSHCCRNKAEKGPECPLVVSMPLFLQSADIGWATCLQLSAAK